MTRSLEAASKRVLGRLRLAYLRDWLALLPALTALAGSSNRVELSKPASWQIARYPRYLGGPTEQADSFACVGR